MTDSDSRRILEAISGLQGDVRKLFTLFEERDHRPAITAIDTRLRALEVGLGGAPDRLNDYGKRLDKVERFQSRAVGYAAGIGAVVGFVAQLALRLLT